MLALIFLVLSFVFGVFLFNWLNNDKTGFSPTKDGTVKRASHVRRGGSLPAGLRYADGSGKTSKQALFGVNFSFLIFSLGLGLAVSGYAVLVLALVLKSLFWGLSIFSILGVMGGGLFFTKFLKILNSRLVPQKPKWSDAFLFLMAAAIVVLGLQSMLFDAEGLPFGVLKGWGDGAYHLNMVQRLATADPFVLDQPVAGGRVLSYPVLVNFLSAILDFGGLPLPVAWHLPTLVFGIGLVLAFFHLGKKYLNKNSLAVVFVFLVLFGAGLGYFWFFDEVQKDAGQIGWVSSFFNNFFEPKFEYSHLDTRTGGKLQEKNMPANIVWIVPAVSFFSHQRSFIVGGFLGALFLLGFMKFGSSNGEKRQGHQDYFGRFLQKSVSTQAQNNLDAPVEYVTSTMSGNMSANRRISVAESEDNTSFDFKYLLLLGLLPLAHTHSFLALFVLASCLIIFSGKFFEVLKNKYVWLASALALSQLAYLFYALSQNGGTKIVPWLGWMACKHSVAWFLCDPNVLGTDSSILWFWLKNFGVIFVVWLISLVINGLRVKELKAKELVLPSVVLFILPNILLFQPWEFDNNKIIFWWWTVATLLALSVFDVVATETLNSKSETLNKFQNSNFQTKISKKLSVVISRSALVIFVISSSFAGVIDTAYRLESGLKIEKNKRNFGYYGQEELKAADWIKNNTQPNDIFLTSASPTQFVPMLSGRPIYLGFTGWLWTQGGDGVISDRRTKISEFAYSGNTEKLCLDGVRYWLQEPGFFKEYPPSENQVGDAGETVFELGQRRIIKLNCN